MNKFLLLLGAFLFCALPACSSSEWMNTDSKQVFNTTATIADFDLPDGYQPDFTTSWMGYTLVSFRAGDQHSHLYLIQSEKELEGQKLTEMLDPLAIDAKSPQTRMSVVETRPVTVRGQEGILVISEGSNFEGENYRQVTAAFDGKGGPALLVLSGPIAGWNQEKADAIIASIH